MKRIAVFSDTHGSLAYLPFALEKTGEIDAFIHLGDFASDTKGIFDATQKPFWCVRGNCDISHAYPPEQVVEIEDVRLFLCHGHQYRDIFALSYKAEAEQCNIVLYGHTHVPLFTAQGPILILNPGSLTYPRMCSSHSCALLTIDRKDIRVRMLPLE